METLHGSGLAQKIRSLSDNAARSVSIVSPYLGRWPAICGILGGNWWRGSPLVLRIVTDISTPSNVNAGTLKILMNRGAVRSLTGVHAKIYIFDKQAVVTSANLTETAFTRRHEIGIYLDSREAEEILKRFESWWGISGTDLTENDLSLWSSPESPFGKEREGLNLPLLWPLPSKPIDALFIEPEQTAYKKFKSFRKFIASYKELAGSYSKLQRLWKDAPLYLEVDSFLNYLFHEATGNPSLPYYETKEPRQLSPEARETEIAKHVLNFKAWALSRSDERWRERHSTLIQRLLASDHIAFLTIQEVKAVVDCLNCMNAHQLNKYKFLQPHNNSVQNIRKAWGDLLFGSDSVEKRMQECDALLKFFGPASVQELLGWFFPNEFPIRNGNSDAGLRFFGFRV